MDNSEKEWQKKPSTDTAYAAGLMLVYAIFAAFALSAINFLAGGTMQWWIFPTSVMVSAICAGCSIEGWGNRVAALCLAVVPTALVALVCHFMNDPSYDGNAYHQEEIALMLNGWNPYHPAATFDPGLWASHYAKAIEMVAATVVAATGSIESGKVVNFMLIFGAALYVYAFVRSKLGGPVAKSMLFIAVVVANPVGLTQMLTYYIDYTKYYYLLLTIVAVCSLSEASPRRRFDILLLFAVTCLAIATKFNIFFEQGIAIFASAAWLAWRRRMRAVGQICAVGVAAIVVGACVLCYHPYYTNWSLQGNPFYPLLGDGAVDIMTSNTPERLVGNRFVDFFISYFTFSLPSYDTMNGFGLTMPLLLAMSVAVFVIYRSGIGAWMWYALAWVVGSCFFFAQGWWARYSCQLWFVPVAAFYVVLYGCGCGRFWRVGFVLLFGLSTLLSMAATAFTSLRYSWQRHVLYEIAGDSTLEVANVSPQFARHLDEKGVRYVEVLRCSIPDAEAVRYYGNSSDIYFPVVRLAEPEKGRVERALQLKK